LFTYLLTYFSTVI